MQRLDSCSIQVDDASMMIDIVELRKVSALTMDWLKSDTTDLLLPILLECVENTLVGCLSALKDHWPGNLQ